MSSFPGVDYMDIDSLFSEDELMVRQTVRDFVDDEVLPIIEHCNREEKFPVELIPKMAEMGLFGATISDYGLPGLNGVAYGLAMQELERGDSGLRSFASVQGSLVMYPIHAFAPLSTHESPSRRAYVRMPPGFEPKSGSVRPKQPIFSPAASFGIQ